MTIRKGASAISHFPMRLTSQILDHGWEVKRADGDEEWLPVAVMPTNIHLDLIAHKKYAILDSYPDIDLFHLGSWTHSSVSTSVIAPG